ncbi:hypothetical protein RUMTOR_00914 [[Ruminococcus] torques ATCC 27756]|uniref:Uncharacterized protein n=1 Tax=[Ruminococcus] torques ATCC 27756 TaxID=411460 RepID=A5KL10_9FIRM|nr:hypothetical protein RUMTOR_00914 [[Ruminococcus] torques ATCC 27756]
MSQDILFQYCAAIRYKRVRAGQEDGKRPCAPTEDDYDNREELLW